MCAAVTQAGAVAMAHFGQPVRQWEKADGSLVSAADFAANDVLVTALGGARPSYGIISEESGGEHRGASPRTFLIDPIDGTRGFLRGERYWSVVAAVIEGGRPVAGAVFEPVRERLFSAYAGGGAVCAGARLTVSRASAAAGAKIAVPASLFRDRGMKDAGIERAPVLPSLAVRLMRVAAGRYDAVVTKPGAHHWDLAAADIIVQEAGGTLVDLEGRALRYDTAETKHPSIVAAPTALAQVLLHQLGRSDTALPH